MVNPFLDLFIGDLYVFELRNLLHQQSCLNLTQGTAFESFPRFFKRRWCLWPRKVLPDLPILIALHKVAGLPFHQSGWQCKGTRVNKPTNDLLLKLFLLNVRQFIFQALLDGCSELRQRTAFTVIFGKIIVEFRQHLLFDLAYHDRKIDSLTGELSIGIILRIGYVYLRGLALNQSNNCLFKLRQRLSSAHLQKIILAFAAREWLASERAFEIHSDKISLLYHGAIFNRLQLRMTLSQSTQRLIDLLIGDREFDFLDLDPQIVLHFDHWLDLENR